MKIIALRRPTSYILSCTCILLFSVFLRFVNYYNRWGLAYDQAHDAIIAKYALIHHLLPLLGPFSSAGPFQTGGEWYWLVMLGTLFNPWSVIAPWLFMTTLYVGFVAGCMYAARRIADRTFSLLAGVLATVSTAQIAQGTNLTNQTPIALLSLGAILAILIYLNTKKLRYLFLLGLVVGIAASIHLQGVMIGTLIIGLLLTTKLPYLRAIPLILLGVLIPWVPVFIAEFLYHFFNTYNMVYYYLHDQYRVSLDVLGRRWLTFGGVFIPKQWAYIIGNFPLVGYAEMALIFIFTVVYAAKKKIARPVVILALSVLISIFMLRYVRTPLFESYLVFLHPVVLLLTAWVLYQTYTWQRYVGLLFLVIVSACSLYRDIGEITHARNTASLSSMQSVAALQRHLPNKKFDLYVFNGRAKSENYELMLYLQTKGLLDEKGYKVALYLASTSAELHSPTIHTTVEGYRLLDLHASQSATLKAEGWQQISPRILYNETEQWYKK